MTKRDEHREAAKECKEACQRLQAVLEGARVEIVPLEDGGS